MKIRKSMSIIIIAEAGVNHNGSLQMAKKLITAASKAGSDYVKFQTFKANKLVNKSAKTTAYQNIATNEDLQYNMLKRLEIPEDWYAHLIKHANKKKIGFLSSGFDNESIDFLDQLGSPLFKIPSGEITNKPGLIHIAQKRKPIILSSGMATMNEIKSAIEVLTQNGLSKEKITILHCNTDYPTPMEDVNLLAMLTIQKELEVNVGYSDHTIGIEVPIAAAALGAKVIEKHFTLNRNLPGPDHKASLEPEELKKMVKAIRNIELAVSGSGFKMPSVSEKKNLIAARKSIVASKAILKGEIFTNKNLTVKRPGNGINPMLWDEVIGKKAIRSFLPDDLIET